MSLENKEFYLGYSRHIVAQKRRIEEKTCARSHFSLRRNLKGSTLHALFSKNKSVYYYIKADYNL